MKVEFAVVLMGLVGAAGGCGAGGGVEATRAALHAPTAGVYEDPVFGVQIEVPDGFEVREDFENPGAPAGVIQRRVVIERPGGGPILLDYWENAAGLSLQDWLNRYGELARYRPGPPGPEGRFGPARLRGIRETAQSPMSPRKEYAIVHAGRLVLRVLYVDVDRRDSQAAFERVLQTLRTRENAP